METILALADLAGKTSNEVIEHLCTEYSGNVSGFDYGSIDESDIQSAKQKLNGMTVLVAYEHVGSYGCDSQSFFILKNEKDQYFEIHGGHCSCYGFEGQLDLELTTLKALKDRANGDHLFSTGGYDDESEQNIAEVNKFILAL